MRKPTTCICENKDANQLHGNRKADHRLCFRYTDSTIPLVSKSKISSFYPAFLTVQACLCRTCSETKLLVFPGGGSYKDLVLTVHSLSIILIEFWVTFSLCIIDSEHFFDLTGDKVFCMQKINEHNIFFLNMASLV